MVEHLLTQLEEVVELLRRFRDLIQDAVSETRYVKHLLTDSFFSVDNYFKVLRALASQKTELTIQEVADLTKLSRSSISKILSTLHAAGLVARTIVKRRTQGYITTYRIREEDVVRFAQECIQLLEALRQRLQEVENKLRSSLRNYPS
jgi:predicted transcriptional regulator